MLTLMLCMNRTNLTRDCKRELSHVARRSYSSWQHEEWIDIVTARANRQIWEDYWLDATWWQQQVEERLYILGHDTETAINPFDTTDHAFAFNEVLSANGICPIRARVAKRIAVIPPFSHYTTSEIIRVEVWDDDRRKKKT